MSVPIGQIPSHFNPPSPAPNLREKPMVTSKGEAKRGTDRGDVFTPLCSSVDPIEPFEGMAGEF